MRKLLAIVILAVFLAGCGRIPWTVYRDKGRTPDADVRAYQAATQDTSAAPEPPEVNDE